MLEEVDEEIPLSDGPSPPSPPEAAQPTAGVTLLFDRATLLVDQIRSSSPFAATGNAPRPGGASPTTASSSQLHATASAPAANAFLPSSPASLLSLTKPASAQRSLTVSTADEVYSLHFSPDLESLAIDNCNLSSLPLQVLFFRLTLRT